MDSVVPPVELHSLSSALARGDRSLTAYLNELQARFEAIETGVQAFIPEPGRFKRLHASAEKLLSQYLAARTSLPLFGLPVGIKDIFHIDGWITQAGASLPSALLQGPQAASVTRLLKAGALIAGKTVTTEFAYFHPGPTRNPRNLAHTPGGSSSGSAAAVAAGLATLALGTQTIGSIIRPAAYCGVVGYKPSYDRISRDGVIPLAPSVDHVGVFSVDTAGAALAASILCSTWQPAGPAARPVLGIPSGPYLERAGAVAQRYFDAAHRRLAAAGYLVQVRPVMEAFPEIEAAHQTIVAAEASAVHSVWFSQYSALYHPETAALIRRGQGIPDADLQAALDKRLVLRDSLCSLMRTEGIDLWISPAATGPAPFGLESTGDPVMNLPWTFCGLPALTVPAGRDRSGLPLGIQIIGDWYADERLLAWAVDIEDRLKTMEIEDNENSQSNFTGKRR